MEPVNSMSGFRNNVRFTHYRFMREGDFVSLQPAFMIKRDFGDCSGVSCRGGVTTAEVIFEDRVFVGEANCSQKDNFCKRIGREIAYGRAMKSIRQYRENTGVAQLA